MPFAVHTSLRSLLALCALCTLAAAPARSAPPAAAPGPAAAVPAGPEGIAVKAGCMVCHAADKKLLGPSLHDLAARYKAAPRAVATLATHVRSGSKGTWGPVPMPASDQKKISDADLATVIGWMLKH